MDHTTHLLYKPDFTEKDCEFDTTLGKAYLNFYLAKRQKIDKKALDALIVTHQKKDEIFAEMRECDDPTTLKAYAEEVTKIYFEQQRLWNFPEDPRYHRFWEMPKCKCPKIDNGERIGTDYTITNLSCPIHGRD